MNSYKVLPTVLAAGTLALSGCLFKKDDKALSELSDGYCVQIAVTQVQYWKTFRSQMASSLNQIQAAMENPSAEVKSLREKTKALNDIVLNSPIINQSADGEVLRLLKKTEDLLKDEEKNKKAIGGIDFEILKALNTNAKEYMASCHDHVKAVTKGCQEQFDVKSGQFQDCANPKLKEKFRDIAPALFPGLAKVTKASSELKDLMMKLPPESETTPSANK